MEFTKGDTNPKGDCEKFAAGISILADGQYKKPWYNRIECYGNTAAHAEELRDQVLGKLGREAALREELENKFEIIKEFHASETLIRESLGRARHRRDEVIDERDALQQRLTVADQRAGELDAEVARLTDLSAANYEAWFIAGTERDRLKSFTQQMARQQGEPYFSKLAKAALKPAERGDGS